MFQRGEQLGEEMYQMSKFNTFAGEGTSLDGVDKTVSWIEAFFKGLGQTYSDPNEWENFALGFLTFTFFRRLTTLKRSTRRPTMRCSVRNVAWRLVCRRYDRPSSAS